MNESLKLILLRAAANNATSVTEMKQLLDFITEDDRSLESKGKEVVPTLEDGVYVVFASGEIKPASEYNEQDGSHSKVLMVYHGHAWIVAPCDAECGKTTLLKKDAGIENDSPYYKAEIEALNDFNMESCTAHLRKAGLAFDMDDDSFIPTAGQLAAMWLYRDSLNKALKDTGGEPLNTDEYYWSSSEDSEYHSWIVNYNSGHVLTWNNKNTKYYPCIVRPCTAFTL